MQCVVYPLLGYFVAFGGMLCQVALGIVMTRASETVIKDWERTLCPPNPPRPYHFSYTEYPVLSVMLVNGCVNRRPIPRRGELAFGIASFLNDPKAQIAYHFTNLVRCCKRSCTSGLSADEMLHSSVNHGQVQQGGMDAANPIFRMETKQQPASKPKSKWNAPPSLDVQARNLQSSWNASPPVAQSAPPPRRPPKSDRVQLMGNSTQMKVQYNPDVEF